MKKPPKSRIYTRTGDTGTTSLFGGKRVPKNHPRVSAYGSLDELNAALGLAKSFIQEKRVTDILTSIQNDLFNIGAELANPQNLGKTVGKVIHLSEGKITELENLIDEFDAKLPLLTAFILPAGTTASGALHLARSIARRTEREIVFLAKKENVNPNILSYTNRLSDLLFIFSRHLNKKARLKDMEWKKD